MRLALALAACMACSSEISDKGQPAGQDSTHMNASITDVLARHTEDLMSIPGVVGTGQGVQDDKPCIIVFVEEKTDSLAQEIPSTLEGWPVRVDVVGEIRPLR